MLLLWLAACSPTADDTAETGDTSDTSETGDTSDTSETGDTSDTSDTGETDDTGRPWPEGSCHPWFPVDVAGARWIYLDPSGEEVTWASVGDVTWEGHKVVRLDIAGAVPPVSEYFACSSEGLELVGVLLPGESEDTVFTFDPPVLFLPAEPAGGMTWSTETVLTVRGRGEESQAPLTAEGTIGSFTHVVVPAGNFSALPFSLTTGDVLPALNVGALVEGIGSVQGGGLVLASWSFPMDK